ncbi:hypothetical protein L195_g032007, partial [Trifolium pratense]
MERKNSQNAADAKIPQKGKKTRASGSQPTRKSTRLRRSTEVKVEVIVLSFDSSDSDEVDADYAEFLKTYKPQDSYPRDPSSSEEGVSQMTVESKKPLGLAEGRQIFAPFHFFEIAFEPLDYFDPTPWIEATVQISRRPSIAYSFRFKVSKSCHQHRLFQLGSFEMAEEQPQNPPRRRVVDYSWVPPTEDFEVRLPSSRQQICGTWSWGTIHMYEIAFKHLGFKLPFTDLEISIFHHLRWKRFFELYEESVRGFKEEYYGVRPITLKGWQNFVRKGNRVDEAGREELDDQGRPIEEDFALFPFYWMKEHYAMASNEFVFKLGELSREERELWRTIRGAPLYDEDGQRVTSTKLIDKKGLLACDTPKKLSDFWRRMTSALETLRQAKSTRNKRATGSTTAASSALGTSSR